MQYVLRKIAQNKAVYSQLPFFSFLRDQSRSVEDRLAFYPCMASFILDFGDFNRYVLRDEVSTDPHQAWINAHTLEDDHHWPWYLEDFAKLGFNNSVQPCELLQRLYGEDRKINRLLAVRLAHMIWSVAPSVRLAIVEAIEETGNVLFRLTAKLASEYRARTGTELRYCGDFHLRHETGHAIDSEHAVLAAIEFDDLTRQRAVACVNQVFQLFEEWTDELLRYALRHGSEALGSNSTDHSDPSVTYDANLRQEPVTGYSHE